jgi:hypothetical protein
MESERSHLIQGGIVDVVSPIASFGLAGFRDCSSDNVCCIEYTYYQL